MSIGAIIAIVVLLGAVALLLPFFNIIGAYEQKHEEGYEDPISKL